MLESGEIMEQRRIFLLSRKKWQRTGTNTGRKASSGTVQSANLFTNHSEQAMAPESCCVESFS